MDILFLVWRNLVVILMEATSECSLVDLSKLTMLVYMDKRYCDAEGTTSETIQYTQRHDNIVSTSLQRRHDVSTTYIC